MIWTMSMAEERLAKNSEWFVYIIEADDGSYYTGVSTDVQRRFEDHSSKKRGARYFLGRNPRAIVYVEDAHDKSSSHRREAQIKKLSRKEKAALIQSRSVDS